MVHILDSFVLTQVLHSVYVERLELQKELVLLLQKQHELFSIIKESILVAVFVLFLLLLLVRVFVLGEALDDQEHLLEVLDGDAVLLLSLEHVPEVEQKLSLRRVRSQVQRQEAQLCQQLTQLHVVYLLAGYVNLVVVGVVPVLSLLFVQEKSSADEHELLLKLLSCVLHTLVVEARRGLGGVDLVLFRLFVVSALLLLDIPSPDSVLIQELVNWSSAALASMVAGLG